MSRCYNNLFSVKSADHDLAMAPGYIFAPIPQWFHPISRNLRCLLFLRESARYIPPLADILFQLSLNSLRLVTLISNISESCFTP